jgi:hypothetical protein
MRCESLIRGRRRFPYRARGERGIFPERTVGWHRDRFNRSIDTGEVGEEYRVIGDLPARIAERMASLASSIEHTAFDFL